MRLASIVFFTAFFSVEISAQEEIVLWHTTFKRSSINFSSAEIKKNFKVTEVTNMPPVRSQDKVSICYAFALFLAAQMQFQPLSQLLGAKLALGSLDGSGQ